MLIGYVQVSKSDGSQTLSPQRDAMLQAGVEPGRIYQDLASGRHDARPGLLSCLKALQPGNTLVLWKLDRLGRDLRHLVTTAGDLRVRGAGLWVLTGAGAQIDTTTANGRLAFGIFAAFAEFERELIAERTAAGLAAARARGRMGGRPRKMDRATLIMAMAAMSDPKANAADGGPAPRHDDHHALHLPQRQRLAKGGWQRRARRHGHGRQARSGRLTAASVPIISDTAYPRLPSKPGAAELEAFTPEAAELAFARQRTRQPGPRLALLVLLKAFQRLGYAIRLADVPPSLVAHVAASAGLAGAASEMAGYDDTSYRIRLMTLVRGFIGVANNYLVSVSPPPPSGAAWN